MKVYGIFDRVSEQMIENRLYLAINDETLLRQLITIPDGMDGEHFVVCRLGELVGTEIVHPEPCTVKICKLSQCAAELDNILALKD